MGDDALMEVLRHVGDVSSYKSIPPTELMIPGDAEKFILFKADRPDVRYIAKSPKNHGVNETLTEYLINCIGMRLKPCAFSVSRLGKLKSVTSGFHLRFLSLFFHTKIERLTHGIQLFSTFYSEEEMKAFEKGRRERNLYTVEDIRAAIELVYSTRAPELFREFIGMCVFDALVGNQDRHAKNWGFVEPIEKAATPGVRFAPVFDSARGFFWNSEEADLKKFLNSRNMDKYVESGTPQISIKRNSDINHVGLVDFIRKSFPDLRSYMRGIVRRAEALDLDAILGQKVFQAGFSPLRRHLIRECLRTRIGRLKGVLS